MLAESSLISDLSTINDLDENEQSVGVSFDNAYMNANKLYSNDLYYKQVQCDDCVLDTRLSNNSEDKSSFFVDNDADSAIKSDRLVLSNEGCNDKVFEVDANCNTNVHFFKTNDHVPRKRLDNFASSLSSEKPNTESNNSDLINCVPRSLPKVFSDDHFDGNSVSSLLELSVCDEDFNAALNSKEFISDLSKPEYHTAELLIKEIEELNLKINSESNSSHKEAQQEAERIVNEACNNANSSDFLALNPGLTVNIPDNAVTYTNLIDLSIDESEIVRQERERVSAQRRQLDKIRRKNQKAKSTIPEPDLLEFFDPNRHVFQSVNLDSKVQMKFHATLSRASDDYVNVFYEQFMTADPW